MRLQIVISTCIALSETDVVIEMSPASVSRLREEGAQGVNSCWICSLACRCSHDRAEPRNYVLPWSEYLQRPLPVHAVQSQCELTRIFPKLSHMVIKPSLCCLPLRFQLACSASFLLSSALGPISSIFRLCFCCTFSPFKRDITASFSGNGCTVGAPSSSSSPSSSESDS